MDNKAIATMQFLSACLSGAAYSWNTGSKFPLNASNRQVNGSTHSGQRNISNPEQLGDNSPAILTKSSSPNHKKRSISHCGQILKHLTRRLNLSKVHRVCGARARPRRRIAACIFQPCCAGEASSPPCASAQPYKSCGNCGHKDCLCICTVLGEMGGPF